VEPCQINFVRRDDFLKLLLEHLETYASTAPQLSTMYRSDCEQIRCLGLTHTATEKLAGFLLQSARKGQETNQGVRFHPGANARGNRAAGRRLARNGYPWHERPASQVADRHQGFEFLDSQQTGIGGLFPHNRGTGRTHRHISAT
jgi:hypothetical protein